MLVNALDALTGALAALAAPLEARARAFAIVFDAYYAEMRLATERGRKRVRGAPAAAYAALEAAAAACAARALRAASSSGMIFVDILTDKLPRWLDDELARLRARAPAAGADPPTPAKLVDSGVHDLSPSPPWQDAAPGDEGVLGDEDFGDNDDDASTGGIFDLNLSAYSPPELPRRVSLPTPVPEPFELMGAQEDRPPEERMFSSFSTQAPDDD